MSTATPTVDEIRGMNQMQLLELLKRDLGAWNTVARAAKREHGFRPNFGQGAYLRGAYLRGAYLRGAYLRGADLEGADLRGADLEGAGAEHWRHPLWHIRQDLFTILDHAPNEVAALRAEMMKGNIDGSTYSGACACLCGTVAKVHEHVAAIEHDTTMRVMKDMGISPDSSRPIERWFAPIGQGDKPSVDKLDAEKPEWRNEGEYRITTALAWLDEWVALRTTIAKAFAA